MLYATYNIEAGGFKGYDDFESKEPSRLPELQAAFADINADVIALPDSFRWHELFKPADIKKMFGYDHSISVPLNDKSMRGGGNRIGVSLLSKREFVASRAVSLGFRDAVHVRIEDDNSEQVDVFAAYLYHAKESRRVCEAYTLHMQALSLSSGYHVERSVAMGDLNTTADVTFSTQVLGRAARMLGGSHGLAAEFGEACRGTTLGVLQAGGFVDASSDRRPTFPTPRFTRKITDKAGKLALPPLLRLDYILASEDMTVITPTVRHEGPVFKAASDHYPISAEIV